MCPAYSFPKGYVNSGCLSSPTAPIPPSPNFGSYLHYSVPLSTASHFLSDAWGFSGRGTGAGRYELGACWSHGTPHPSVPSLHVPRATRLFCDVYNPQSKTYCKRLQVLCPEHSRDPKVEDGELKVESEGHHGGGVVSVCVWGVLWVGSEGHCRALEGGSGVRWPPWGWGQ